VGKEESNQCSRSIFSVFKLLYVSNNCILVDGLNVYITYYFMYIVTIKPDGGGGQYRLYIVIFFIQKKTLAVSEGVA